MTQTNSVEPGFRETLVSPDAAQIIDIASEIGKVMLICQAEGVTHERIGQVESAQVDGGEIRVSGAAHDARIDPSAVASVVLDTTSVMGGKVYPRLDFLGSEGEMLFAILGMDGLDAFLPPVAGFARSAAPERPARAPASSERPEVADDDPGRAPLALAREQAAELRIIFERPGLRQSWRGRIEALKPAMGFLNVMTPDFHLHMRGGSVARWREEAGRRIALDHEGRRTDLVLESEGFA